MGPSGALPPDTRTGRTKLVLQYALQSIIRELSTGLGES